MHTRENNKALHEKLKQFMQSDRAKHNLLAPSKFGVVEITRQRVRPETDIKTAEVCPTCNGTGEVQASILYAEEIESKLKYLLTEKNEKALTLQVHPYIASYFKAGFPSRQWKWLLNYKKWVKVQEVTAFNLLEYKILNGGNKEIEL
jgi:ribonuclease G